MQREAVRFKTEVQACSHPVELHSPLAVPIEQNCSLSESQSWTKAQSPSATSLHRLRDCQTHVLETVADVAETLVQPSG